MYKFLYIFCFLKILLKFIRPKISSKVLQISLKFCANFQQVFNKIQNILFRFGPKYTLKVLKISSRVPLTPIKFPQIFFEVLSHILSVIIDMKFPFKKVIEFPFKFSTILPSLKFRNIKFL